MGVLDEIFWYSYYLFCERRVIFMKVKTCNNCSKKKTKDEKKDCAKQHSIHDPSKQGCIAWKGDK